MSRALGSASPKLRSLAIAAGFACVYFLIALLTESLVGDAGVAVLWPASGVYLGVLLVVPHRRWRGLVCAAGVGSLAFYLHAGSPLDVSVAFAVPSSAEGFLAAVLVERIAKRRFTLSGLHDVFALVVGGALVANALIAVSAGAVAAQTFHVSFLESWLHWWSADALGMLAVAPIVTAPMRSGYRGLARLWSGQRIVALGGLGTALVAMQLVGHGSSLIAGGDASGQVYTVQAFLAVLLVSSLAFAASVAERRRIREELGGARARSARQLDEARRRSVQLSAELAARRAEVIQTGRGQEQLSESLRDSERARERAEAELAATRGSLDVARRELEELGRDLGLTAADRARAQTELRKSVRTVERLEAELSAAANNLARARAKGEAGEKELERARAETRARDDELETARAESQALEHEARSAREQGDALHAELETARAENVALTSELERIHPLVKELDSARSQNAALRSELERARKRSLALTDELDTARAENGAMKGALERGREQSEALNAELDSARVENAALKGELERARERSEVLNAELDSARAENAALSNELETRRERSRALAEELESARAGSGALGSEVQSARQRIRVLEDELERALAEQARIGEKLSEAGSGRQRVEEELALAAEREQALRDELERAQRAHQDAELALDHARARFSERREQLERSLGEAMQKLEGLESQDADRDAELSSRYDERGTCLAASPSFAELLGYEPQELVGRPGAELLHPEDRPRLARARAARSRTSFQARLRRKAGDFVWVEVKLDPVWSSGGERLVELRTTVRRFPLAA